MKMALIALGLVFPLQASAINPPHWSEFSKGEFIDTANVKSDGNIASAYVKYVGATKKGTILYEVDCDNDQIRVHSDTPRYIRVPVAGGGSVVESDDGFRTVVPGTQNARIESAICGLVAQIEAQQTKKANEAECQREKTDINLRVMAFEVDRKLTYDEAVCLSGLNEGQTYSECDAAKIPQDTDVIQYLHDRGLYLKCENRPQKPQSHK